MFLTSFARTGCCDECTLPSRKGLGFVAPARQGCPPGSRPTGMIAAAGSIDCESIPSTGAALKMPAPAAASQSNVVGVRTTIAPVTQIQVSPQISPVFQQSSGSGGQSAGTQQTSAAPQSAAPAASSDPALVKAQAENLQRYLDAQERARADQAALLRTLIERQQAPVAAPEQAPAAPMPTFIADQGPTAPASPSPVAPAPESGLPSSLLLPLALGAAALLGVMMMSRRKATARS